MNPPQVYMCSPSWTLLPPPSPHHPSGSSQCTSPKQSSIVHRTWTGNSFHTWYFTCFNAILPNLPTLSLSHKSIRLFYTSVSLLLSRTQGYCYHLSKFHIYALVYGQYNKFLIRKMLLHKGTVTKQKSIWILKEKMGQEGARKNREVRRDRERKREKEKAKKLKKGVKVEYKNLLNTTKRQKWKKSKRKNTKNYENQWRWSTI